MPGSDLVVRAATLDDVPQMALVMEQASAARKGEPLPAAVMDSTDLKYLEERLRRVGAWSALAIMDSEIVGFVVGNPVGSLPENHGGGLDRSTENLCLIMVSPKIWGHGIGQRLLKWAADFHRRRGRQFLELWTQEDNLRARALYEHLGYTLTGAKKIRDDEPMVHYRSLLS